MEKYKEDKHTVFLLIIGQLYGAMKNKVESHESFDKIETNDDVVKLLELIKSLTHANEETKYEFWTMVREMKSVIAVRQFESELVVSYYKRLVNLVKVTELKWGLIVSTKMAESDADFSSKKEETLKKTRDKFLACVFLDGLRKKRFGKCLGDLNNAFLAKQNNYPKTMEGALNFISNYVDNDRND